MIYGLRAAAAGLVAALTLLPWAAPAAERAPVGDIEITVGSAAGATPDMMMRRVAKILNESGLVTQPIVVVNRTGGGWTVAANYVLGHPGDENMLFALVPSVFTTPIVQNLPNTYEKVTPIALFTRINLVVLERADTPDADLAALVARAKKAERSVSFGGANVGSTDHIVASLIEKAGGVKFNYVPFDGGGGLLSAFLGGNIDAIVLTLDEAYPLITANKVKPVAILSDKRVDLSVFKDIPTATEQKLDVVWGQYYGIAGPPDLSPEVAAWWSGKLAQMVETPAWKTMMDENFLQTDFVGVDKVKPVLDGIYDRFLTILRELKLAKK